MTSYAKDLFRVTTKVNFLIQIQIHQQRPAMTYRPDPGRFPFAALPFLLCFLLSACSPSPSDPGPTVRGFYHWQGGNFTLSNQEQRYLDSMGQGPLFLRLFDIDYDASKDMAVPLSTITIADSFWRKPHPGIIPTLFITNRSFQQIPRTALEPLAQKTLDRVRQVLGQQGFSELQIDCDWTATTREAYFYYLQHLRRRLADSVTLSATIRLHQVADPGTTGVPPVDRGTLMAYNSGNIAAWTEKHSILNLEASQRYLQRAAAQTYPLPLDLAVPLFHWGLVYRLGKLWRIINGLDAEALQDSAYFHRIAPQRYEVRQSTYLESYYLYQQDLIRLEQVAPARLAALLELLRAQRQPDQRLLFYHLDSSILQRWPYERLDSLLTHHNY